MLLPEGLTPEQRNLAKDLAAQEVTILADPTFPKAQLAMCLVCLAHDWFQMDMEDKGFELLVKAENAYPGYFDSKFKDDIKANKNFATLAQNITIELYYLLTERLKEKTNVPGLQGLGSKKDNE